MRTISTRHLLLPLLFAVGVVGYGNGAGTCVASDAAVGQMCNGCNGKERENAECTLDVQMGAGGRYDVSLSFTADLKGSLCFFLLSSCLLPSLSS